MQQDASLAVGPSFGACSSVLTEAALNSPPRILQEKVDKLAQSKLNKSPPAHTYPSLRWEL